MTFWVERCVNCGKPVTSTLRCLNCNIRERKLDMQVAAEKHYKKVKRERRKKNLRRRRVHKALLIFSGRKDAKS